MTEKISYSIGDTAKMTGVSQKQLRSWSGKFIQEPERIVCGQRSFRRFSEQQIQIIQKVKAYLDQGFTLSAAAQLAVGKNKITGGITA